MPQCDHTLEFSSLIKLLSSNEQDTINIIKAHKRLEQLTKDSGKKLFPRSKGCGVFSCKPKRKRKGPKKSTKCQQRRK